MLDPQQQQQPIDPEATAAFGRYIEQATGLFGGVLTSLNPLKAAMEGVTATFNSNKLKLSNDVAASTLTKIEAARLTAPNTQQAKLPEAVKVRSNLPPEVKQPAPSRPGAGTAMLESLSKVAAGVLSMFFVKLTAILAPLLAFATVLNSASSGFRVFLSAINVLAGTLAPILLPVFVLLSATILTLSDYIWSTLQPALGTFYSWIINNGVDALSTFVNWLQQAWQALQEFAGKAVHAGDVAVGGWEVATDTIAWMLAKVWSWFDDGGKQALQQIEDEQAKRGVRALERPVPPERQNRPEGENQQPLGRLPPAAKQPGQPDDFRSKLQQNLKLSLQEFRFQNGPQASFTGLVQASRAAQTAALNESPFERIIKQRMEQAVQALEQVVDKLDKPQIGP